MPPPGGDFIGRRRLDAHLDAFKDLGARVDGDRWIELSAPGGLRACAIFMDEPSVMGTENALMAAALTPGPTTIANAACEPHVQDLARLLAKMGARVEGIGSNVMTVHGAESLGRRRARDLARPHRGRQLHGAGRRDRRRAADPRRRAGRPDHGPPPVPPPRAALGSRGRRRGRARPSRGSRSKPTSATRSRRSRTVPGRPSRPTSPRSPWRSPPRPTGEILIFEKMFENRLFFVDKLVAMGARITLCDPHRAIVSGPSRLHGERVESPDIRAGMAMLIAALAADGRLGDRQHPPDRSRLRADRRAPARARRADRTGLCGGPCLAGLFRRLS